MKDKNITSWPKLGINYWGITKCANSTIKIYFYELENNTTIDVNKHKIIHNSKFVNYITSDIANSNNLINFTVTRNPYSRFISIYRDMIKSRPNRGEKAGLNSSMTIDDLLDYLYNSPDEDRDVHLRSQYSFISEAKNIVMLDSDKLTTDWPFEFPGPSYHKNVSSYKGDISLTDTQKHKIWNLFKQDFINLNYQK